MRGNGAGPPGGVMRGWLVRLYPRAWRQRYGPEFTALLEQQPLTPRSVLDVVRGALDAHRMARRQRRIHTAQVQPGRGKKYAVKRGQHPYSCSFCGKPKDMVRRLIAGPHVYICNECIALCNEIIAGEEAHMPPTARSGRRGSTAKRRMPRWWQCLLDRQHRVLPQADAGPWHASS
jgi:hypothetical protein